MIEVIIPTIASADRAKGLLEAIDSVQWQCGVNARPLILLNGSCFDSRLKNELETRSGIRLFYQEEGSLPKAIFSARTKVQAEYFCFLDDDDLLLDQSLLNRLQLFREDPALEVVVGNGYLERFGENALLSTTFDDARADPLAALVTHNWLASCGGLFKASAIGSEYFTGLPMYLEWTWVAFNLAVEHRKIAFVDAPTFRVRDTDCSLSKESGNTVAFIELTKAMLAKMQDAGLRAKLRTRLGKAYHMASSEALSQKALKSAWIFHTKSINSAENLGYLAYTRHLIRAFFK